MKLCVLFPGIGYHCGKPLLSRSAEIAEAKGYTVIRLNYCDFPEGAKGNSEKMRAAAAHAIKQTKEQLADTDFSGCERIVFIGKSIGTAACTAYREARQVKADCILLTPLELTFEHPVDNSIAFHGTADQWADTESIRCLCRETRLPLYEYTGGNHSLMTDDPQRNEEILEDVMRKIEGYL